MPLQKQKVVFPLSQGIDTKTDEKQLVTGKMRTLENVQQITPLEYRKRNGYDSLGSVTSPQGLGTLNQEVVAFANFGLSTYSPGNDEFVPRGISPVNQGAIRFQGLQLSTYKGGTGTITHYYCDSAYHSSGKQAFVWLDSSSQTFFTITDYDSKASLFGPVLFQPFGTPANTALKVFVLGSYFIILHYNGTSLYYTAVPVTTTSGSLTSYTSITSSLSSGTQLFDATVLSSILYIVYKKNGTGIGIASLDESLNLTNSTLSGVEVVTTGLCISRDTLSSVLNVAFYNGSSVRYLICNTSFVVTSGPTTVETIGNVVTVTVYTRAGAGFVYYEVASTSGGTGTGTGLFFNNYIRQASLTSGAVGTPADYLRSVGIVSKVFSVDVGSDANLCMLVGYTGAQPSKGMGTVFVTNQSGVVIGKFSAGNCSGISGWSQGFITNSAASEVNTITASTSPLDSGTVFTSSFLLADFAFASSGTINSQYGTFGTTLNFDSSFNYRSVTAANNLHATGGILTMYDGQNFVEHGYHIIPESPTANSKNSAGANNLPAGPYSWVIVYEWLDAQGAYHRSATSTPYTIALSGTTTYVQLTVPTLRITQKYAVLISVYRNTLAASTIFNLIGSIPGQMGTSSSGPLLIATNSTSADTVTIYDGFTDVEVEGHLPLYTTGGVVDNDAAPAAKLVKGYRNRLIVFPSESANTPWISKEIIQEVPASPVSFSSFFTIPINTLGGDPTSFIQMDEKGIVFKNRTIFAFTGDGPNDTGTSNDLSVPQQVSADNGCDNDRSVVLTPNGVLYHSEKGIYLLDRSLSVSYIGKDVEAYNDDPITSSILVPNTTQVRFTLTSGACLVYDYFTNQWMTYTNHATVDSVVYNELYTRLSTGGILLQETVGVYSDNGSFISQKFKTGWLSFDNVQGFQRIFKTLLMGEYKSAHKLSVSFAFDFNPNPFQTITVDPSVAFTITNYGDDSPYGSGTPYGGAYPIEWFTLCNQIQRCSSMQITLEEVYNGVVGESFSLSSLGFEVGVEGGLYRMPSKQKFG